MIQIASGKCAPGNDPAVPGDGLAGLPGDEVALLPRHVPALLSEHTEVENGITDKSATGNSKRVAVLPGRTFAISFMVAHLPVH